jgi:hypothetical protein
MITALVIMVITLLLCIGWLIAMILIEKNNTKYQKELRKIDNEYVQHYIHVVVTYRKWKKDVLELKAMLRDCYWDSHRKPILKMINQNQKSVRMLRNLLNKYYFDYNQEIK